MYILCVQYEMHIILMCVCVCLQVCNWIYFNLLFYAISPCRPDQSNYNWTLHLICQHIYIYARWATVTMVTVFRTYCSCMDGYKHEGARWCDKQFRCTFAGDVTCVVETLGWDVLCVRMRVIEWLSKNGMSIDWSLQTDYAIYCIHAVGNSW